MTAGKPRTNAPDTMDASASARQIAALRDSLHKALADLERAEAALGLAATELEVARQQIRTMRRSRAWRLTAPVRRIVRRVAHGEAW